MYIAKGNVVELKSGGPKMTVESSYISGNFKSYCDCVWFEKDNVLKRETFEREALKVVE